MWLTQRPTGKGLSGSYNNVAPLWETIKAEYDRNTRLWSALLPAPAAEVQGVNIFASVTTAGNVTLSSIVTEAEM